MNYIASVVALVAFYLALKAWHMQRNTTRAVSEYIRGQDGVPSNDP